MRATRVFTKAPELPLEASDVCLVKTVEGRTVLGIALGSDCSFSRVYPQATRAFLSRAGELIGRGLSLPEIFRASAQIIATTYLQPDFSDPFDSKIVCAALALVHRSTVEFAVLGPAQIVVSTAGLVSEVAPAHVLGKVCRLPIENPMSWVATKGLTVASEASNDMGLGSLECGKIYLGRDSSVHIFDHWPSSAIGQPIPYDSCADAEAWRLKFRRPYVAMVSVDRAPG